MIHGLLALELYFATPTTMDSVSQLHQQPTNMAADDRTSYQPCSIPRSLSPDY